MRRLFLLLALLTCSQFALADTLYSNGGDIYEGAAGINIPGAAFSDGFVDWNSGTVMTLYFIEGIVVSGDTPTSISWSLGTSAFGSDVSSGTMGQVDYTYLSTIGSVNLYDVTVTGLYGDLVAGSTYYLTLVGDPNYALADVWETNGGPASCYVENSVYPTGAPCDFERIGDASQTFTLSGTLSATSATPEPASLALLSTGMLGMAWVVRRRFKY